MAIIITFSGLVGTGKSVCSRYVASELYRQGLPVYYLRFRLISLKSFFQPKKQITRFKFKPDKQALAAEAPQKRFADFQLRSNLSFGLRMGYYLWKTYLFWLLVRLRYAENVVVADRYVYDHLVQYRLSEQQHWFWYRLFNKLLPRPHLPFLLYSDEEKVAEARPGYHREYLRVNLANYRRLPELFPETILVAENDVKEKLNRVYKTVTDYLTRTHIGG